MATALNASVEYLVRQQDEPFERSRRYAMWLCDVMLRRPTSSSERAGLRRVALLLAADERRHPTLARRLVLHALPEEPCPPGCRLHAAGLTMALGMPLSGRPVSLDYHDVGGLHRQLRRLEREDRKRPAQLRFEEWIDR